MIPLEAPNFKSQPRNQATTSSVGASNGMKRRLVILAIALGLVVVPLVAAHPASAQGLVVRCNQVTTVDGKPTITNPCDIRDFFNQFVILVQFGYSIIAVLSVLLFIYGGFQFLTAGGRQEKVTQGQRIISGTVTGLVIALTAYIIVNFTVSAITGTTARSLNPFGGIATVFGPDQSGQIKNINGQNLEQPFSGNLGDITDSCHSDWDNSCSNQVFCSDPGTSPGNVARYQGALNVMECGCGTPTGCFGSETVACVRRFQIANFVAPSGVLDEGTMRYLDPYLNAQARRDEAAAITAVENYGCNRPNLPANFVSNVSSKLPTPNISINAVAQASSTTKGCCVVRKNVGGTVQPFNCLENVSQRACTGLSGNNIFAEGENNCGSAPSTKDLCGICVNLSNNKCFDGSGKYWCGNVVSPAQSFNAGRCPDPRCSAQCDHGLRTTL